MLEMIENAQFIHEKSMMQVSWALMLELKKDPMRNNINKRQKLAAMIISAPLDQTLGGALNTDQFNGFAQWPESSATESIFCKSLLDVFSMLYNKNNRLININNLHNYLIFNHAWL